MPRKSNISKKRSISASKNLPEAKKRRFIENQQLTNEKLLEWKKALANNNGRVRTSWENCLIIQEICYYLIKNKSESEIMKLLVDIHGGRMENYLKIWHNWINDNTTEHEKKFEYNKRNIL